MDNLQLKKAIKDLEKEVSNYNDELNKIQQSIFDLEFRKRNITRTKEYCQQLLTIREQQLSEWKQ